MRRRVTRRNPSPILDALETRETVSSLAMMPVLATAMTPRSEVSPPGGRGPVRATGIVPSEVVTLPTMPSRKPEVGFTSRSRPIVSTPPAPNRVASPSSKVGSSGTESNIPVSPTISIAPRSIAPAPPAAAGVGSQAVPIGGTATSPGAIRPLALAPPSPDAPASAPVAADSPRSSPQAPSTAGQGTAVTPSYSSGGGNPGNPTITYVTNAGMDSSESIVGGWAKVTLSAPAALQSVTWQVSGAMKSQSYTNAKGKTTPLPSPANPDWTNGTSSQLTFYWDASPGIHNISASVVYAGNRGSGTSNAVPITVLAPKVDSFKVDYTKNGWGDVTGGGVYGFHLDPRGLTYNAQVSLGNSADASGSFAFIQVISENSKNTNKNSGLHSYNTGGYVLDNFPSLTQPTDPGYLLGGTHIYGPINPGGSASTPVPTDLDDDPRVAFRTNGGMDTALELDVEKQIVTNLVFKTTRGLWVGLSQTTVFSMTGSETYDTKAATWSSVPGSLSPAQAGTLSNLDGLRFVTWTNYYTQFGWDPPINS